jgi:hypothetical protein
VAEEQLILVADIKIGADIGTQLSHRNSFESHWTQFLIALTLGLTDLGNTFLRWA